MVAVGQEVRGFAVGIAYRVKAISPAATAATAAPVAPTCAATPSALASTVRARLPNTW